MTPHIQVRGRVVTVDGRVIAPLVYPEGRRANGTVFFDRITGLYIKLGRERAEGERRVWERAGELGLQHHLAPIVASGPTWNAFRRVHLFWQGDGNEATRIAARLNCDDATYPANWGLTLDGTVVLIDYEPF